jgi:hypothetical protein
MADVQMDIKQALAAAKQAKAEDLRGMYPQAAMALGQKVESMFTLLLECRDALPAISLASAKLRGLRLDLADRVEVEIEPWRLPPETRSGDAV